MVHGPKGYDMDLGNPWARWQFALTFETLSSSKMLAKNGYLKWLNSEPVLPEKLSYASVGMSMRTARNARERRSEGTCNKEWVDKSMGRRWR